MGGCISDARGKIGVNGMDGPNADGEMSADGWVKGRLESGLRVRGWGVVEVVDAWCWGGCTRTRMTSGR